jgi:synaptic vesicle membrane protein VAT-1
MSNFMRELVITRHGGPDVLEVRERPTPEPGPGEVRIAVRRAGLGFSDIAARVGIYPEAPKPPGVVGYEVCGTVDAMGPGATGITLGTRVLAPTRFGGQASHVIVPARYALAAPDTLSDEEAAALPVNYLTAFHMLFHVHWLKPGSHVLIQRAAGGVGLAVIQLARTVPGVVIYGTASPGKHDFLRREGVQHPIDYTSLDYVAEVKRLTGGRGVDLVLDPQGGPDWKKGYSLLKPAGHLIAYGWANMSPGERLNPLNVVRQFLGQPLFSAFAMMGVNRSVSGVNMGSLWNEEELLSGHLEALLNLARAGKVKPHIDQVFRLSDGPAAHRRIQSRQNVGKIVFDCTA